MCVTAFKGQTPHNLPLCASGHRRIHTSGHEINFPSRRRSHISRRHLQFCEKEGEMEFFVPSLDMLESAGLILGFRAESVLELQI